MSAKQRFLEFDDRDCAMPDRLTRAALRVGSIKRGAVEGSAHTLRADQIGVYTDFADFLSDAANSPETFRDGVPTGRIILPPRTGKTVLAGQIIAGAGMMTTFIVPKLSLVFQTARDLAKQLPDIPIGTYSGESKNLVMWGINVTTYQILQRDLALKGHVPIHISLSSLVFADEGHHAMTEDRQKVLKKAFDPLAVRVALTATPNYDVEKRLERYFERLIHEITISEAVELEMISPLRVWIAEVDVDASRVSMKAGEFDEIELGRVMGAAPFFEATRVFRYSPSNRKKPALICCVTRQQAYDLQEYLQAKRPKGTPVPTVIVGETKERERILSEFSAGLIDTLINVGVLIEGWNSPRCKLLIDLTPSHSWVRATQKFFRPMTRWKNQEASIYLLIPKGLPMLPVLPMDLLGWDLPEYRQGELIASRKMRAGQSSVPVQTSFGVIKKVALKSSIVFEARFEKPRLDPKNAHDLTQVLLSNKAVSETRIPGYMEFRNLWFDHSLFKGRGQNLLRFCGVRPDRFTYIYFMAQFFPEAVSDLYLGDRNYSGSAFEIVDKSCEDDLAFMNTQLVEGYEHELDEDFEHGWMAIGGHLQDETESFFDFEEDYIRSCRLRDVLNRLLGTLPSREEMVLRMSFGIEMDEYLDTEIAEEMSLSKTRIYQMEKKALRCLRHQSRKRGLEQFRYLLW